MVKVSIIVPVYNTEKFLEKCLRSLVSQTLKEIEIICVDDGSVDNSLNIIKKFAKEDSRIKVIEQENKKQGAARNNGTKIAKGEYIGFVDSDDWVDIDYYEKMYIAAKKYDSDIALATNIRIGNGKTKKRVNIEKEEFYTDLQSKFDVCNQWKNPCPTNKIYRLSMLKENNVTWPEGCYCEDKLFTVQAVYWANGVVTVPNVNYYYYRNPKSTVNLASSSHVKKCTEDKNASKKAVLDFLRKKNAPLRDGEFWEVLFEKRIFGIQVFSLQKSLRLKRFVLLGIKVWEKVDENI